MRNIRGDAACTTAMPVDVSDVRARFKAGESVTSIAGRLNVEVVKRDSHQVVQTSALSGYVDDNVRF